MRIILNILKDVKEVDEVKEIDGETNCSSCRREEAHYVM